MRALVIAVVLVTGAMGSSGAESSPFEFAESGPVMLWYERLQREEALSKIASFREWAADYLRLWHARGAGEDESLADVVSGTERLLSLIPERAQRLDRRIFDAVAELSELLFYYPPEPRSDKCDAYFVAYGNVNMLSPTIEGYFMAKVNSWQGRSYGRPREKDEGMVFRGTEKIGTFLVDDSKDWWDGGKIVTGTLPEALVGDVVVITRPVPDPHYVRRMKRLGKYYGNMIWSPDVEEPWPRPDSHELLRQLEETFAERKVTGEGGRWAFLAFGIACGVGLGAVASGFVVWLLTRRKRGSS